jgi:hypothetical protein
MLTTLPTLKARLAIEPADPQYDTLLTNALTALGARFDKETNRTLARTEALCQEFDGASTQILAACYPIESVTKFETKTSEATGWEEITPAPGYLIRCDCVISLAEPFCFSPQPSAFSLFRVVYTGGYVLPGSTPTPGQTPLPPDLENAAVEQIAFWFKNRDHLGLKTYWPTGTAYFGFATQDLLDSVRAVLARHTRLAL